MRDSSAVGALQSPPMATRPETVASQVPAQHMLGSVQTVTSQLPDTHWSLSRQAAPSATVPVMIRSHAGSPLRPRGCRLRVEAPH